MPDGKTDGSSEGPAGVPIGRALVIPPGVIHDDLREAVRIVSRIHGDGDLPPVPMRVARLATSRHGNRVRRGRFVLNEDTGQPTSIVIEAGESHRVFAALHEIGHLLDLSGIGPAGRFASRDDQELATWRRAAARSRAIAALLELSKSGADGVDHEHVAGLLDPVEAWARSYAQYIVNRSDSPTLRASLEAFRRRVPGRLYYPQQWEDDDFGPIESAIEELFRRLGWRRSPKS